MRIGFDVSQTGSDKAGCGYFADSLVQHLARIDTENSYVLYPTFGDFYWDPDWPWSTRQIDRPNLARGLGHTTFEAARLFWRKPPQDWETQLGNPDIIHSNNFFCPSGLRKARLVYTLHDLGFLEHPEWTTEENRICCFTGVFNASLFADLIIAVSEHSRRDFLDTFPHYPADHVEVVYEASRFTAPSTLSRPQVLAPLQAEEFWLTVSTLEPRKNHTRLLEAYSKLKALLGSTFPLVLAGGKGWLMEGLDATIDEMGLQRDVVLLGYVDDCALRWLYQNCYAFLYPSLFEGFGLPVVEAMTLGAPVICSDSTSLPEIVGGAGVLVDPYDADEIFRAMTEVSLSRERRHTLKEAALRRAKRFSWTRTAVRVLDLYQEVVTQPRQLSDACA
jgi:glycosyltransferase involved in cell wall biosynthesis